MFTYDDMLVSDLHKDARGFRPGQQFMVEWKLATPESKQEVWDMLCAEVRAENDYEAAREAEKVEQHERMIEVALTLGAPDRETAIRWVQDDVIA